MYQRKFTSLADCGSFISTHHTFTEANKQKVQNLSPLVHNCLKAKTVSDFSLSLQFFQSYLFV